MVNDKKKLFITIYNIGEKKITVSFKTSVKCCVNNINDNSIVNYFQVH